MSKGPRFKKYRRRPHFKRWYKSRKYRVVFRDKQGVIRRFRRGRILSRQIIKILPLKPRRVIRRPPVRIIRRVRPPVRKVRRPVKRVVRRIKKVVRRPVKRVVRRVKKVVRRPVKRKVVKRVRKVRKVVKRIRKVRPTEAWQAVSEFQEELINEIQESDFELANVDVIQHTDQDEDVIHLDTRFIWPVSRLPDKLKYQGISKPFRVVRVWFIVYDSRFQSASIWARAVQIPLSTWAGAREHAEALMDTIEDEFSIADYWEVSGLTAWTAYSIGTHIPQK